MRIYRDRRAGGQGAAWQERRSTCWSIANCEAAVRNGCHAFIVGENCWDFWAIKGAKYKRCCQRLDDCAQCPIVRRKFAGELPVYVKAARGEAAQVVVVCAHLQCIGATLPEGRALRQFLREQEQDERVALRCRQRGVRLDVGYVADVCTSRAARECVFL